MQALAGVLLDRGYQLSGSDANLEPAQWLRRRGVALNEGEDCLPLDGSQSIIFSDAVPAADRERRAAARLGLDQSSYPEALAALMAERRGLAVAGTHGKSTTTAMIGQIMTGAGLDPTIICGATPIGRDSGGRAGSGDWLVAEACEYRENFRRLRPEVAIVLGIEHDHVDYYRSVEEVERAFGRFVARVPRGGMVIANSDCAATRRAVAGTAARLTTFGLSDAAAWRPARVAHTRGRHRFKIRRNGRWFCRVELQVPGRHQVANALAAAAACSEAGASASQIAEGLGAFRGLRRRLEHVARAGGIDILDDYAHHPTEVRAVLAAVRLMYPGRRVWCIFQPHQLSRMAALVDEFAASLQNADRVAVAEVFVARERLHADPLGMAKNLAERARVLGADVLPDCRAEIIVDRIAAAAQPGDVVITVGAGDIRKRCDELADRF
jgi:UDP-N-acetylmuramate--alanine ligase